MELSNYTEKRSTPGEKQSSKTNRRTRARCRRRSYEQAKWKARDDEIFIIEIWALL
jgi:hypothetical protein